MFARSHHSRPPFVLDARGGQFGLACSPGEARGFHRLMRLQQTA
jgi:hypothetical protein